MRSNNLAPEDDVCFKLKGSRVTMTIMELYNYNETSFAQQIAKTVKTAPDFFQQTPVIVSLDRCMDRTVDFGSLIAVCRSQGLFPIAVRGGSEAQLLAANATGLPTLPAAARQSEGETQDVPARTVETRIEVERVLQVEVPVPAQNKIITTPVRSGQQIYAPNADLIVVAPVSAGAEILADGNIHVYGPLRGRALAGVKGNTNARIFCQSQEAELISIAGIYKVSEDLKDQHWRHPVQACLEGSQMIITPLQAIISK